MFSQDFKEFVELLNNHEDEYLTAGRFYHKSTFLKIFLNHQRPFSPAAFWKKQAVVLNPFLIYLK